MLSRARLLTVIAEREVELPRRLVLQADDLAEMPKASCSAVHMLLLKRTDEDVHWTLVLVFPLHSVVSAIEKASLRGCRTLRRLGVAAPANSQIAGAVRSRHHF